MATLTNDYVGPVGIARWVCRVMGVVFLIVAVWGFLSRDDMLMGLFMVNGVHNVVHLLSGAVLLALGFATESTARMGLWVFTAVYGLVMILGFLGVQAVVDLLHLNRADNWLHLLITLITGGGAAASASQANTVVTTTTNRGTTGTTLP